MRLTVPGLTNVQFTQDRFVDDMLGLRRVDGSEFMSSANRVLKTTRCFLKDDGTPDTEISDNDPDRHGASSTTSADRTEDNEKMALALRAALHPTFLIYQPIAMINSVAQRPRRRPNFGAE